MNFVSVMLSVDFAIVTMFARSHLVYFCVGSSFEGKSMSIGPAFVQLFNSDPKRAVQEMRRGPLKYMPNEEVEGAIVDFLIRENVSIDKEKLGELFGLP
jgi:hypothetical protein